jgi:hypothetical protein
MMIPQNKNVCQLVWNLYTAVEGSELYCYNTEGNRNSAVSKVSYKMDVTRLEQCSYIKIPYCKGEMLENATVSLWKLWGTMPFCTELSNISSSQYG